MKHLYLAIALAGVWVGAQAPAADALAQSAPAANKHQMMGCMTKRMSASRTVSYNDARKACIAQLKPQTDSVPHPLTAAR